MPAVPLRPAGQLPNAIALLEAAQAALHYGEPAVGALLAAAQELLSLLKLGERGEREEAASAARPLAVPCSGRAGTATAAAAAAAAAVAPLAGLQPNRRHAPPHLPLPAQQQRAATAPPGAWTFARTLRWGRASA